MIEVRLAPGCVGREAGRHVPKAAHGQRNRRRELELFVLYDEFAHPSRERRLVRDPPAVGSGAVRQQGQPDLERGEGAAPLRPVRPEVERAARPLAILNRVRRREVERVERICKIAQQYAPARMWGRHPLVRVEGDRVGMLDSTQSRPQIVRQHVDVQPQTFLAADAGDLRKRIDRAGRRRSRRRDDGERLQSRQPVGDDRGPQAVRAHPERGVDRHRPHRVHPQSEHVRCATHHRVRLRRRVQHHPRTLAEAALPHVPAGPAIACHLQRRERRHRSARSDHPAGRLRQPESRREPLRQVQLDLGRGGRVAPPTEVLVERRRKQIRDRARNRSCAGDVAHETWMPGIDGVVEHHRAHMLEQLDFGERLLRHVDRHGVEDLPWPPAPRDRQRRKLFEERPPQTGGPLEERGRSGGVPIQVSYRFHRPLRRFGVVRRGEDSPQ